MKVTTLDGRELPLYGLDFETYYDKDYTLSKTKMTTTLYVRDERFKAHGVGIQYPDGEIRWHPGDDAKAALEAIDWDNAAVCMHNAAFDGFILSQIYGVFPAYYVDTMAMSRGLRGMNGSHSLKALVSTLGIDKEMGNKIEGTLDDAKGVRDLPPDQLRLMGEYCIQDVRLTMRAFERMMAMRYPVKELHIIDMVCRAFCDPQLLVDTQLCLEEIDAEQAHLSALLEKVGVPASRLASNQQFAQLLVERGIDPPMKPSPTNPDQLTWALGAKDPEFIELGKNPDIADLIVARKKVKSRIAETRAHTLIAHSRPTLPLLINYGATQTHRLSGGDKLNCMHPDVEVLTPSGWVRLEDWDVSDPIVQWELDGTLSWVHSSRKVVREEQDHLVWFDAPFVGGGFTSDHRFIGSARGEWKERTAGWIADHSGLDGIPVAGTIDSPDFPVEDWQLRFLVALAADGSVKTQVKSDKAIFGFTKVRKIERMREILSASTLVWTEHAYGPVTRFDISPLPDWAEKGYGPWVLALSARQLRLVVDEMVHWDGFSNARSGQPTFSSVILEQAQWFATAAHLAGYGATLSSYERPNVSTGYVHYVYIRQTSSSSVDTSRQVTRKPYSGKTYCPTVPSSYVLVRYDDRIFVTGQCQNLPSGRAEGQSTRLRNSIQAPPGYKLVIVDSAQIECVCGDSLVLTQRGEVPIVDVTTDDLVWDGIEWVPHEGVVFKGYREVLSYDGVTATPDHVVYTGDGRSIPLAQAALEAAPLLVGAREGRAVRALAGDRQADSSDGSQRSRLRALFEVWLRTLSSFGLSTQRIIQELLWKGSIQLEARSIPAADRRTGPQAVYDLVNAGPRHRFCCDGVIVSNCRVAAALAGEEKLLGQFRTGGDPYSDLATKIFGYPVKKGMLERNVGKAGILACQYGVGRVRIHTSVTTGQAGPPMDISMEVADKTVRTYRAEMRQIVNFWNQLDTAISHMARPNAEPLQVGIFSFQHERVMMPNGLFMYYPGLFCTDSELGDWTYKKHQGRVKLYSMKLFEQLVQSTSRTIFLNQTLEVAKRYPRVPFTVHDEAIFLVKEDEADDCLAYALECFARAPEFLPDVPLEGEGQISPYYTK